MTVDEAWQTFVFLCVLVVKNLVAKAVICSRLQSIALFVRFVSKDVEVFAKEHIA